MMEKNRNSKKRRIGFIVGMFILLMLAFTGGRLSASIKTPLEEGFDNDAILSKVKRLEAYINTFYLDDIDSDKVTDGVYHGLVSGLGDPYSEYYTKQEYQDMMDSDAGEYRGIGIIVYKESQSGYVVIESVMKDQPAYNAGIQNGDIMISVDGVNTTEMTLSETVGKIKRGEADTVKLTILRNNQTLDVEVDKKNIVVESVEWEMKENNIGYISVAQFIENTDEHFITAVDELEKQGMKGLIIDLRDNGGGLVDTCINMVSRIIPENDLIVSIKDKNEKTEEYKCKDARTLDMPIVILANENTASASEIMTGCLKDYGLVTVIGGKTFGKGIVQNVMPLGDGSAIKLTVAAYYTPKGTSIHKQGIEPDIDMAYKPEEWLEIRKGEKKDTQMEKAISVLKEKQ